MAVMIPVYILNALYLAPITLWTYLKYGRPPTAKHDLNAVGSHHHTQGDTNRKDLPHQGHEVHDVNMGGEHHNHSDGIHGHGGDPCGDNPAHGVGEHHSMSRHTYAQNQGAKHDMSHQTHMQHLLDDRPFFATTTIAVCHCGAGCLLGDIVGEWLVFGTGAQINGRDLWVEFLVDYAFALVFGIFFQYYSIAPMSGDWGLKTVWRAAKADFLSLTSFELGLFAWMAIFQVAIFDWKLEMNTATYWWMMQIGMFLGHWTAFPINWWLIKSGIKEPCA